MPENSQKTRDVRLSIHVGAIYFLGIAASMATGILTPLIPDLQKTFTASAGMIGFAFSAMFLPMPLLATLIGRQIDRLGSRTMMFAGGCLIFVASVANTFATGWLPWLFVDNFMVGSGLITVMLSGQTEISRLFAGSRQSTALSVWAAGPFAGISIGLMLSAVIAGTPWWRAAFAMHAALILILAPIAYFSRPADGSAGHTPGSHRGSFAAVVREVSLLRLAGISLLQAAISSGGRTIWPLYLSKTHDVSIATIAGMSALTSPLGILGSFCTGWLLSLNLTFSTLLIGCGFVAIASGMFLYAPSSSLTFVGIAMLTWSFAVGTIAALIFAMLPKLVSDTNHLGAATGLVHQIGSLGPVIGPPILIATTTVANPGILLTAEVIIAWLLIFLLMPLWRVPKPILRPLT